VPPEAYRGALEKGELLPLLVAAWGRAAAEGRLPAVEAAVAEAAAAASAAAAAAAASAPPPPPVMPDLPPVPGLGPRASPPPPTTAPLPSPTADDAAARRHAELAAAEVAAAEARAAADGAREHVIAAMHTWCGEAGWSSPKAMRRAMRSAAAAAAMAGGAGEAEGRAAAASLAVDALAGLLRTIAGVPALAALFPKPPLAAPAAGAAAPRPAASALKKAYMGTVRALHPDKTGGEALEVRLTAEAAFTVLTGVWECYQDALNGHLAPAGAGGAGGGDGAGAGAGGAGAGAGDGAE